VSSQTSETVLLYSDFLPYLFRAQDVRIIGPATGTPVGLRVWILLRDVWKAFRISDQISGGSVLDNPSASGAIARVSTAVPGVATATLGVRFPTTSQVNSVGLAANASSEGSSAMGGAAVQFNPSLTTVANMVLKNEDGLNAARIGSASVTAANGYRLEALGIAGDNLWLRNVIPASVYGIAVAGTPTVAWATFG